MSVGVGRKSSNPDDKAVSTAQSVSSKDTSTVGQSLQFTPQKKEPTSGADASSAVQSPGYIEIATPSKPPGTTKLVSQSGGRVVYDSNGRSTFTPDEKVEYIDVPGSKIDRLDLMIGSWIERIGSFDESFDGQSNIIPVRRTIDSILDQIVVPEVKLKGHSTTLQISAIDDDAATKSLLIGDSKEAPSSKKNKYDHLREHFTDFARTILEFRESLKGSLEKGKVVNLYADVIQLKFTISQNREIPFKPATCFYTPRCPKREAIQLLDKIAREFRDFFSQCRVDLVMASIAELEKRRVFVGERVKSSVFGCVSG